MSTTTLTLNLTWGTGNDARDIEVPYRFVKSDLSTPERTRYHVDVDGTRVGWVVYTGSGWAAYLTASQHPDSIVVNLDPFTGQKVTEDCPTRRGAVDEMIFELRRGATWNALRRLAVDAYPDHPALFA